METLAFQDESYSRGNCCRVCGNDNPRGLYIKSYWDGDESIRNWQAEPHQTAGWPHVVNGGIISDLIDCHCVPTAFAAYYKEKPLEERASPRHWFATASLKVDFLKPAPLDKPVQLRARIADMQERKVLLTCSLFSGGQECARGEVLAVRVPAGKGPGQPS